MKFRRVMAMSFLQREGFDGHYDESCEVIEGQDLEIVFEIVVFGERILRW